MPAIAAFLLGLIIGSFQNVCICRLPKDESVVTPRSRCPKCGHWIAWYENIPLLSYLVLRGKCSGCGVRISPQYFFIELLCGLLFAFIAVEFASPAMQIKFMLMVTLLLPLAIIDFVHRILPDELTLTGFVMGLVFSLLVPVDDGSAWLITHGWLSLPVPVLSLLDALLGAAFGAGLLYGIGELWLAWRGIHAMGFGDVKLMAFVGAFLGTKLTLLTIFLGSLGGSVLSLPLWIYFLLRRVGHEARSKRTRTSRERFERIIPGTFRFTMSAFRLQFGTVLSVTALVAGIWGKEMLGWYLGLLY